jgi:hypothetical protein
VADCLYVTADGDSNWIVWEGTDGTPAQLTGGGLSPYTVLARERSVTRPSCASTRRHGR